jgi:hypothetical protein
MAYYIFLKSWRSLEEFRKNPHLKISPKSPSTNFQSLAIIKNQIFIRKRIFLHFRPIRPSGQPAYTASRPTPPPGLRFPHPACRPTPPPDLRPVARPSWPTREVVSLLAMQLPPSSAPSRRRIKPPWLPQPSPRPPLLMADRYPSLIPALITIYRRYSSPPFNPRRRPFPNSSPGARPLSPPDPYKRVRTTPGLHHPSPAHSPPLLKLELPGRRPSTPRLIPHRRPAATLLPAPP